MKEPKQQPEPRQQPEQHRLQWVPYSMPPPQTWAERARLFARRYSFAIALGFSLVVLASVLWMAVPANPFGADARADQMRTPPAAVQREENPLFANDNPYAGNAVLSVESRPSGATVMLGGDTLGLTPLREQSVPAGVHLVSVYKEGHTALDSVLLLRKDRAAAMQVALAAGDQPPRRAAPDGSSSGTSRMFAAALRRGDDLFMQDRYAAAHQAYQQALRLRPGHSGAMARFQKAERAMNEEGAGTNASDARREPSPPAAERADGEEARSEETSAEETSAAEARAAESYAAYRRKGDELFDERKYQEAAEYYQAAQQYRPDDEYVEKRLAEAQRRARVVGW